MSNVMLSTVDSSTLSIMFSVLDMITHNVNLSSILNRK